VGIKLEGGYLLAVIGAGPAGLYAAGKLAGAGGTVLILNRDIRPGGLAEYGIYYKKHKMKEGLRKQFRKILETPRIAYFGNVTVGEQGDFTLDGIKAMGFSAVLVTVGAQATKWLGLPGEHLTGVYHAKDIVYHYNKLPPFSQTRLRIGKKVALIGVGNVMVDIARWLCREKKVDDVIVVARRGPAEVKFTKKEFSHVAAYLDKPTFAQEFERVQERMLAVGQNPQEAKGFILSIPPEAPEAGKQPRLRFAFLSSPKRILGDGQGNVCGLEVEDTRLVCEGERTKPKGMGTTRVLDVDTVVFCIGDKADRAIGLPVEWNGFCKNPNPLYPVHGVSYEAYDPESGKPIEGVFIAGWARNASKGLVGLARKDGEAGAEAVLRYLQTLLPMAEPETKFEEIVRRIRALPHPVADKDAVFALDAAEQAEAERRGADYFRFDTNEAMLRAAGLL